MRLRLARARPRPTTIRAAPARVTPRVSDPVLGSVPVGLTAAAASTSAPSTEGAAVVVDPVGTGVVTVVVGAAVVEVVGATEVEVVDVDVVEVEVVEVEVVDVLEVVVVPVGPVRRCLHRDGVAHGGEGVGREGVAEAGEIDEVVPGVGSRRGDLVDHEGDAGTRRQAAGGHVADHERGGRRAEPAGRARRATRRGHRPPTPATGRR